MANNTKNIDFDTIDKMKITLTKSAWITDIDETTIFLVTKDSLTVKVIEKFNPSMAIDNLREKSTNWTFSIDEAMFKMLIPAIKESLGFTIEMYDAIPGHIICYSKNDSVLDCDFDELSNVYFKNFITSAIPPHCISQILGEDYLD